MGLLLALVVEADGTSIADVLLVALPIVQTLALAWIAFVLQRERVRYRARMSHATGARRKTDPAD